MCSECAVNAVNAPYAVNSEYYVNSVNAMNAVKMTKKQLSQYIAMILPLV